MLFQTCIKLTFCLSDILVITVIARDRINSVGSLFFRDRILRFSENMPQSLKRFLSNFNVVAIQNSLDGFRNTLNVRNNSKTSRWILLILIRSVTSCNWFAKSISAKWKYANDLQNQRDELCEISIMFVNNQMRIIPRKSKLKC